VASTQAQEAVVGGVVAEGVVLVIGQSVAVDLDAAFIFYMKTSLIKLSSTHTTIT